LVIEPAAQVRWIHDPFGNSIAIASFPDAPVKTLEFVSTIQLEHYGVPAELQPIEDYARKLPFSYVAEEAADLVRYVERHYPDPNAVVSTWARQFLGGEDELANDTFATLTRMCKGIQETLKYAMRFEIGTQPPTVTLETGGGTCRDYALLMMEGVRSLGIAAHFVTGYLYDLVLDTADGGQEMHAYPHAWIEVYLPGAGWIEFDPTNGIIGTERLIRVAVGRDPEQAMPIKGSFTGPSGVAIEATVDVRVRSMAPNGAPAATPTASTTASTVASVPSAA
jgi:transglutaminase-like putative cysteine protease